MSKNIVGKGGYAIYDFKECGDLFKSTDDTHNSLMIAKYLVELLNCDKDCICINNLVVDVSGTKHLFKNYMCTLVRTFYENYIEYRIIGTGYEVVSGTHKFSEMDMVIDRNIETGLFELSSFYCYPLSFDQENSWGFEI